MRRPRRPRAHQFRPADSAQQIVGGFLLAGPFVVTEEVWRLAESMNVLQWVLTVGVVFAIGYGALYKADSKRDSEAEQEMGGVPIRFISLMVVSYGAVAILAVIFDAPGTFLSHLESTREVVFVTIRAVSVGAVFAVVGAATADSVF
mgnify:CR=1 FL=1